MRRTIETLKAERDNTKVWSDLYASLDDIVNFLEEKCDKTQQEGVAANEALKVLVDILISYDVPVDEYQTFYIIVSNFIEQTVMLCL